MNSNKEEVIQKFILRMVALIIATFPLAVYSLINSDMTELPLGARLYGGLLSFLAIYNMVVLLMSCKGNQSDDEEK